MPEKKLVALAAIILVAWCPLAFAEGVVSFNPSPIVIIDQDTMHVDIWVDEDVDSLHCFRVLVDSVHPGVTLLDVKRGGLIPSGNTFFFWKDTLGGYDIFACFLGPGTYTNGPGSLARMTFLIESEPCSSPLTFLYVLVQGVQLDSLPVTHSDGEFTSPGCCTCPCAADPVCDSVMDILDVVGTVSIAFRGSPSLWDANCPNERTDVDCSGATDVLDVVRVVNVAFRGANPATEFCQPCP